MFRSKLRGAVSTEVCGDVVAAVVVVGDTGKIGHNRPFGIALRLSAKTALVTAVYSKNHIVVVRREVAA